MENFAIPIYHPHAFVNWNPLAQISINISSAQIDTKPKILNSETFQLDEQRAAVATLGLVDVSHAQAGGETPAGGQHAQEP